MIELLLDAIVALGSNEMQNVLTSVGESAVKKFRAVSYTHLDVYKRQYI